VSTPGSAYVLLHHVFGEVNGKLGAWGHSVGGMGAITQAMARACELAGVEISLESPVAKCWSTTARPPGSSWRAARSSTPRSSPPMSARRCSTARWSIVRPRRGFPPRIAGYKTGSGTFRMNVALSELPDFTVLPGKAQAEHHTAGIIIAPGMDYMDQPMTTREVGWSKKPIVEIKIPSTVDDSLAPAARVASLFCQQFSPQLPDGQSWDDVREQVADHMIDTDHRPRAQLQERGHRPPDPFAARSGTQVRPDRRRHLPRPHEPGTALGGAPGARPRRLSRADQGPLHVRFGHASGRRRDRRPRPQRRAEIIRDRSVLWKMLHRG
jgi:phytoene dehydrogenase-like protein